MNLAVIESDPGATTVGVTTGNRFCGAPVLLARERLPAGKIRAIVVNNKVANVASGTGLHDARTVAAALARERSLPEEQTLSVSTGVIGWSLPTERMVAALRGISDTAAEAVDVAEAIMTTDRYPKLAWNRRSGVTCLGIAKGAGMIEPNLATMLGFIMCDAQVDRDRLERVFRRVVAATFNTISVDGDQSTSDMVVCTANGVSGMEVSEGELEELLLPVCRTLSQEIVRNGEGTAHVIEVHVRGVTDRELSQRIGRHVVNSPLVKTAVYGNDPNVGRILAAAGDALDTWDTGHTVDVEALTVSIAGREVYRDGAFRLDGTVEEELAELLQRGAMDPQRAGYPQDVPNVTIQLSFGSSGAETVVYGSDLSYDYVRENADYRT